VSRSSGLGAGTAVVFVSRRARSSG
jgi:hypothetical protein